VSSGSSSSTDSVGSRSTSPIAAAAACARSRSARDASERWSRISTASFGATRAITVSAAWLSSGSGSRTASASARSRTPGSILSFCAASRSSAALRTCGSGSASAADSVATRATRSRAPRHRLDADQRRAIGDGERDQLRRPDQLRGAEQRELSLPRHRASNSFAIAGLAVLGASAARAPTAWIAITRPRDPDRRAAGPARPPMPGATLPCATVSASHACRVGADPVVGSRNQLRRDRDAVLCRLGTVGDALHDQAATSAEASSLDRPSALRASTLPASDALHRPSTAIGCSAVSRSVARRSTGTRRRSRSASCARGAPRSSPHHGAAAPSRATAARAIDRDARAAAADHRRGETSAAPIRTG